MVGGRRRAPCFSGHTGESRPGAFRGSRADLRTPLGTSFSRAEPSRAGPPGGAPLRGRGAPRRASNCAAAERRSLRLKNESAALKTCAPGEGDGPQPGAPEELPAGSPPKKPLETRPRTLPLRAVHSSLRLPACSAGAGSSSALHGSRCGFLVLSDGYFCPSARFEVYGSKSKLTLFGTGCCSETKITDNPPSPKS